ncbi:MAG: hypothetical protein NXH97_00340 [Rhodobacteraceae bacterium]|nr:hypothetical protein [Paracoccaceae bacterium]
MAFLRLLAMLLVALTVVYISMFFYLREAHREKLEREFRPEATELQRTAFVKAGVDAYAARMGRLLALAVYGVPLTIFAVLILTSNVS